MKETNKKHCKAIHSPPIAAISACIIALSLFSDRTPSGSNEKSPAPVCRIKPARNISSCDGAVISVGENFNVGINISFASARTSTALPAPSAPRAHAALQNHRAAWLHPDTLNDANEANIKLVLNFCFTYPYIVTSFDHEDTLQKARSWTTYTNTHILSRAERYS